MSLLIVSYDLRQPGRDYSALFAAIRNLASACARPLESVWVLQTSYDAIQVRDALVKCMDRNDRVMVAPWNTLQVAAWNNLDPEVSEALKRMAQTAR